MNKFQVAYIPVGVPTFHLESAQEENIAFPKEMLLSLDKLSSFLNSINLDLIIIQNITFANAAYANIENELEILANMLNIPNIKY